MVGFNDNYLDRTAGLRNFAYPQPTAPAQSVEEKSPLGKFLDFATEAFSPGHVAQNEIAAQPAAAPEPAFRNTGLGEFIGNIIPGLNQVYAGQDRTALSQYAQNMPADPAQAIKGMMTADPHNADKYAEQLLQLTAQQGDPLHKLQIQNAELALKSATTEQDRQTALGNYLKALSQPTAPEGGVSAPSSPSGSPPIGAENNNYLNIRDNPANAWEGQTGANKGFATFTTPEHGFRAAAKTLNSYAQEGINTLDGVIQRWAPAADNNDPEKYAEFVSHETGIPRNVSINVADPAIQRKLLGAMQKQEVGRDKAAPQSVVDAGVDLAQQIPNGAMTPVPGFKDAPATPPAPAAPIVAAPPAAAAPQPKSDIQKYHDMALQMGAIDPLHFGDNALAAFAPKIESPTPYTDAGKAQLDYQHGYITKDQLETKATGGSVITPENAHLSGEDFIKTIPDQAVQNMAHAMLRGDAPYPNITSRTPSVVKQALEVAQQADSGYSSATAPVRKATKIAFATGPEGRNVNALNTLINHLGEMSKNDKGLPSHDWKMVNAAENAIVPEFSDTANSVLNNYNIDKTGVGSEAAKAYKGVGAISLEEQKDWQKNLSANNGPETRAQARQEIARLVAGKINALESQWQNAFPNEPKTFISDKAQKTLKELGVDVGDFVASPEPPTTPKEAPAAVAPDSHEDLLKYMTPEERKLFE